MELSSRPPGGSFEKDQGKWHGTEKKKRAKTDTNKAREEIVAFCPRERGAGRFRAETGQEDFIAPELSKLPNTTSALRTGVENYVYFMLHRRRLGGFWVTIWVLFKDKIFNGNF